MGFNATVEAAGAYYLLSYEEGFDGAVETAQGKVAADSAKGLLGGMQYSVLTRFLSGNEASGERVMLAQQNPDFLRMEAYIDAMTDPERNTYLYLLETEGEAAAVKYYNFMTENTLDARIAKSEAEAAQQLGEEHPVIGTALSIAMSPMQIAGTGKALVDTILGNEINPYDKAFSANRLISGTREAVQVGIREELGDTFWGDVASIGYSALTSGGDNLVAVGLGGAGLLSLSIQSISAASSTIMDAKLRGATDSQALLLGGATAIAEAITERGPMQKIAEAFAEGVTQNVRGAMQTIVSSVLEEGVGESVSELFGTLADDAIMGALSHREQRISELQGQGMSGESAERIANEECVQEIIYAGIVGGVSGGANPTISYVAGRMSGRQADAGSTQEARRTAKQKDEPALPPVTEMPQADQAPAVERPTEGASDIAAPAPKTVDDASSAPEAVETTQPAAPTEQAAPTEAAETAESAKESSETQTLARQLTELVQAGQTKDAQSQTATVASVLMQDASENSAIEAQSAAVYMADKLGSEQAVSTMQNVLVLGAEAGVPQADTSQAIKLATMGEGESAAALEAVAQNPTPETFGALMDAAGRDAANGDVVARMDNAILEYEIANRTKELVADGGLDGVSSYQHAYDQATANVQTARTNLTDAQRKATAIAKNHQVLHAEYMANPSNMAMQGLVQQSIKDLKGAVIVNDQMQQSVQKFTNQRDAAKAQLKNATDTAMTKLREQARADVMQRRAEREQALATAQRQQAEAQEATEPKIVNAGQGVLSDQTAERLPAEDSGPANMIANREIRSDEIMPVASLPSVDEFVINNGRDVDRKKVVEHGVLNAKGKTAGYSSDKRLFVINRYTNKPIQVTANSLRHGLTGTMARRRRNAQVAAVIGDMVESAIPVAELNAREGAERSFVMIAAASDGAMVYPVKMIINQTNENMGEITGVEALKGINKQYLYSANAEQGIKNRTGVVMTRGYEDSPNTLTDSTISIADVWNAVKDHFLDGLDVKTVDAANPNSEADAYSALNATPPTTVQTSSMPSSDAPAPSPQSPQSPSGKMKESQFAVKTGQQTTVLSDALKRMYFQNATFERTRLDSAHTKGAYFVHPLCHE